MALTGRLVAERNLTTLMVTHSMQDAIRYGNRLIMMHAGRIILDIRRRCQSWRSERSRRQPLWYHAEVFTASRLRGLLVKGPPIDFDKFTKLKDPALVCYYLFFPGHEEPAQKLPRFRSGEAMGQLRGCVGPRDYPARRRWQPEQLQADDARPDNA